MSDNVKKALDPPPPSPANYLQTQQKCHYVKASLSTGFLIRGYEKKKRNVKKTTV